MTGKVISSSNVHTAALLLSMIFLPSILVVFAWADAGTSVTAGSDRYMYGDLNADVDVSSAVNSGVYFAHYSGDFIPPTQIYSGSLSLQAKGLFGSFDAYYSPRAGRYMFYGGQATLGVQGGSKDLKSSGSLTYGRTLNTLYDATGQRSLHANVLNPSVDVTIKNTLSLRFSYSYYFYQEDPAAFFTAQFGDPASLPSIVFTINGYPSREALVGASWYIGENWKLSLDWDRVLFESFALQQNSVTWGATYCPARTWGITASFDLVDGTLWYYTLGLQWYPQGHEPGEEKQNAISYNDIP